MSFNGLSPDVTAAQRLEKPFLWFGTPPSGRSGAYATLAPVGATLLDVNTGRAFRNNGSVASPMWTSLSVDRELREGLVASYQLTEASGNRIDRTLRGNDLTPLGTVLPASANGIIGQGVSLIAANSAYLNLASNADFQMGAGVSFTISAWCNMASKAGSMMIASKTGTITAANVEYILYYRTGGDQLTFSIANGTTLVELAGLVAPSLSTWYFICGGYDASTGLAFCRVNNGNLVTQALASGAQSSTNAFCIGARSGGSVFWDGIVDNVNLHRKALSDAEMNYLWNNGAGREWPF